MTDWKGYIPITVNWAVTVHKRLQHHKFGGLHDGCRAPAHVSSGLLLLIMVFIPGKAAVADHHTIGGQYDNNIFDGIAMNNHMLLHD